MQSFYPKDALTDVGEPLIPHLLESAKIVSNLELYQSSILATLFSYLPKYDPEHWKEKLQDIVDQDTLSLIEGFKAVEYLTQSVAGAELKTVEEQKKQAETLRKMLLAVVNDIRVVLIKLAMATERVRYLRYVDNPLLQQEVADETMALFAPLANLLGIWQVKWELEDLSFKYQNPEEYQKITDLAEEKRQERLDYIASFVAILQEALSKAGIKAEVAGRPKHIYSIYRKMQKKHLKFSELYDIRAVRILVNTVEECYNVLGLIHNLWTPVSDNFDDYIAQPKANDYQSLHTVIIGPDGKNVEVQIRTFKMHHYAEFGLAAHWKYKAGGKTDSVYEKKIAWLRQLLDWRGNIESNDQDSLSATFQTDIFKDTIYVLSPKGKVLALPEGSTPIDFAYAVHSDIGNRCRGARIDGLLVPLSTPLKTGQRVEIITGKGPSPSLHWLQEKWVKSKRAISRIRAFIRQQNAESREEAGKSYLDKELAKLEEKPNQAALLEALHYKTIESLYLAISDGSLTGVKLNRTLEELTNTGLSFSGKNNSLIIHESKTQNHTDEDILIDGESGLLCVLAKCCKPAPPDSILGFVTKGRGISLHRQNCLHLQHLIKTQPNKIVSAQWGTQKNKDKFFSVDIEVLASDKQSLLGEISAIFARHKVNVTAIKSGSKENKIRLLFTVELKDVAALNQILTHIRRLKEVWTARRL
ncbi:MAG: GTP pyrophosphokinase [Haemophilus parainfluenzae]|nr:MAG: GTP pyrophosphokinase [Haemophilus parainfluenzae]